MTATALVCPVCNEQYEVGVAFALHVASCTAPPSSTTGSASTSASVTPSTAVTASSCPMCHMVYSSAMAAHEIDFHEHECERVNERPEPVDLEADEGATSGGGGRPASATATTGGKRTRDGLEAATTPKVKLFPAHCAVCALGGRTMLRCAGVCARSFHPVCIEELNTASSASAASTLSSSQSTPAPLLTANSSFTAAISRDKKAQRQWVCGECARGVHACQLCGFLGHERDEVTACSLTDCGFFFHAACLRAQGHRVARHEPLVCPRHTCSSCHAIETDMTTCSSCSKCATSVHLRCRTANSSTSGGVDVNFHVCAAHAADVALESSDVKAARFKALRMRSRPGDVVLILEYGNLLLPASAKEAAPDACNQYGIVQQVEDLGDATAGWNQLLTVTLFSDNSSISVLNRYVLPIHSMNEFTSPAVMVRELIKWHAMAELNLRQLERDAVSGLESAASTQLEEPAQLESMKASGRAFHARAQALALSASDCMDAAKAGKALWQVYMNVDDAVRTYGKRVAPVYMALDTRGKSKHPSDSQGDEQLEQVPVAGGPHESEDVDMEEDASTERQGSNRSSEGQASKSLPVGAPSLGRRASTGHVPRDDVDAPAEAALNMPEVESVMDMILLSIEEEAAIASPEGVDSAQPTVAMAIDSVVAIELKKGDTGRADARLSFDDLLNPLSQDSTTVSPVRPVNIKKRLLPEVVKANVLDMLQEMEDSDLEDCTREQAPKKAKLLDSPTKVIFTHLPVHLKQPATSAFVFGRAPLAIPPPLKHKEKILADLPDVILEDLEMQVDQFFDSGQCVGDAELPCFRPAFYRPSPFLYRGPRVGRRVDAISQVLLCQDKRNLKCFVRQAGQRKGNASEQQGRHCAHDFRPDDALSYFSLDLMGFSDMATLGRVVYSHVNATFEHVTQERADVWTNSQPASYLDQDSPRSAKRDVQLYYCGFDGSQHALPRCKSHPNVRQPEWLCFCANVCHLTAVVREQH